MILRIVIILIVFCFIVYVLKAIARLSFHLQGTIKEVRKMSEQLTGQRQPANAEMVRCAACGAFVSSRDAVTLSSRGRVQTFCSNECIQAHVKSA